MLSLLAWPELPSSRVLLCVGMGFGVGYALFKLVWVSVGLAGLAAGFFLGASIYELFSLVTGLESLFLMSFVSGILATIGGWMSYEHSDKVVLFVTSIFGSYVFMRGWSCVFGGFPSEHYMIHAF